MQSFLPWVAKQDNQAPLLLDGATYVREEDVYPDGVTLAAGACFTKVWVLRNSGATSWGAGYRLTCSGDDALGAPPFVSIPVTPPGGEARLSVPFVAPTRPGCKRSTWRLTNAAGQPFGDPVWAAVNVALPQDGQPGPTTTCPPPAGQEIALPANASPAMQAVVGAWNRYGGALGSEANRLGLEVGVAVAVLAAEVAGDAYEGDRMKLRFENHIFYQYWGHQHPQQFGQHFAYDPDQPWQGHQWRADAAGGWRPCHRTQAEEWQLLAFAMQLDERAALLSSSMGAPQIMGFNYATIGYASVQQMFQSFQADVRNQLTSLFRFIEVNRLVVAVQAGDYVAFASAYNGPGQASYYGRLIQEYVAAFLAASA